jgi:hypothetical protein
VTGTSPRFGFVTLNKNDELSSDDYGFGVRNRHLLDELLTRAVQDHRHTGTPTPTFPGAPPKVTVNPGGGILPANRSIIYRTALVDQTGQEYVASQPTTVVTPSVVGTPNPPELIAEHGYASSLQPGNYVYQVTAFTEVSTAESLPSRPVTGALPDGDTWRLRFPYLPGGATGWNIYRRGPTDAEPIFLASTGGDFEDMGTIAPLPFRTPPATNTSSSTASVTLDADIPPGFTMKIYRNLDQTDWSRSLVVRTAVMPYTDTGHATQPGQPLARSIAFGGAPRIRFGNETEGVLPPRLVAHTQLATFTFTGLVDIGFSPWQWINEYDEARIISVRGTVTASAVAQPIKFQLLKRADQYNSNWRLLQDKWGNNLTFTVPPDTLVGPLVPIEWFVPEYPPQDGDPNYPRFFPGDALRPAIIQNGGGDPQQDSDLTIVVTLAVQHGSASTSYTWKED